MRNTKKLALTGILTAMCTALLYLAAVLPGIRIGIVAAAGLLPAVAVIHCGAIWALVLYAAVSGLAFFLLPDKMAAAWFLVVFGHYGVLKSLIERIGKLLPEWGLKLCVFALCVCGMYFLFRSFFLAALPQQALWVLIAVLLVCFVLYDVAFSGLISVYNRRIRPYVEK